MSESSHTSTAAVQIGCDATPSFIDWLSQIGGSLMVSTYQAGKVAMIGWDGERVTLLMREFDKPLGMACQTADSADGRPQRVGRIVMATRHDVSSFTDAPPLAHQYREDQPGRYDALYLPRVTYHTGDLQTHDVAIAGDDVYLVATRFSCLAKLSVDYGFQTVWKPPFVTDVVPEDRCHLNGLAVVDGQPKYVTALGTTDTPGGWRERKADGGVLLDVESGETLIDNLSMPHSPRWHRDRLWLLDSGRGRLLRMDPKDGQVETVAELPGYLRGLCLIGDWAVVGLCKIRERHVFGGLPIQERYDHLQCGVAIVDTRSGAMVGMFEFTHGCEELFDVKFLPNVFRPMIVNLDRPEAREAITNEESSFWIRPSAAITPTR